MIRGVRGATTVELDDAGEIQAATQELLSEILRVNPEMHTEDLACVYFTVTEDLYSVYPAQAARRMGWDRVPLMCACEIPVPGGLPRCIRVLLHWNTDLSQAEIHHVYLRRAVGLRPDLYANESVNPQ